MKIYLGQAFVVKMDIFISANVIKNLQGVNAGVFIGIIPLAYFLRPVISPG